MSEQVIDLGYNPHRFQQAVHQSLKRFSIIVAHRRWGKTVLAVMALVDATARFTRENGHFAYLAPQFNQAKAVAWLYVKRYALRIPGATANESELSVTLPNGAKIRLFGANNPDSLRGLYFDGIVLDEVAQMAPEVWGEVIRPALADRKGWALFIGTPKGVNLFSELYYRHLSDPDWFVGSYDAEMTVDFPDTPLTREELEVLKASMSEAQYRQEMLADFTASSDDTLIPIDVAMAAVEKHLREGQFEFAPRVMGVDVARFGDDRSVIQKRQGLYAQEPQIYRGVNNMDLAGLVAHEIETFKPAAVFVDAGRGEGVIDRLRQLGHDNIVEVNFGGRASEALYLNKRSEMWFKMAEWLASGGAIPRNQELIQSLVVPTYKFNSAGQRVLESKEDIKKRVAFSPDPADALALTFAFPVRPDRFERQAPRKYDPLTYGIQGG